jgi:hypothetical protein
MQIITGILIRNKLKKSFIDIELRGVIKVWIIGPGHINIINKDGNITKKTGRNNSRPVNNRQIGSKDFVIFFLAGQSPA